MKLKVVLESSEDGGYTVYIPSLPGCISEGDTREEALGNIREAVELYMEPLKMTPPSSRLLKKESPEGQSPGVYPERSRRGRGPDQSGFKTTLGAN